MIGVLRERDDSQSPDEQLQIDQSLQPEQRKQDCSKNQDSCGLPKYIRRNDDFRLDIQQSYTQQYLQPIFDQYDQEKPIFDVTDVHQGVQD